MPIPILTGYTDMVVTWPKPINDQNQIVGAAFDAGLPQVGFIWDPANGTRKLNDLVPTGWDIRLGQNINNHGQILAQTADYAWVLLSPLDTTPPVISGLPAPGCTIWPPNHRLVQVATVTAMDALSGLAPGSFKVTGTSNDPANGQIVVTGGPNQFNVQLGADKGQVYTLTATASDLAGNTATQQATCTVQREQGK